jgi:hypothetical protein
MGYTPIYEYGVKDFETGEILNTELTEMEARKWIERLEKELAPGSFKLIRREIGPWVEVQHIDHL